ncbi:GNAT family N-acetyltransferase [Nocardioides zeae]|uniref:GNAT family N-acetyltransferase n=1 Tax=Nocardioides imazamoxiresistens TaxID=3231893 RepID=A0ABU3PZI1_9ACTN|nr:GNAT family N-acetyltransferase [Nocardioides zeae]MDT9594180.1 GNAT family N-acetyltransferase [Nocardioides zeae]
MPEVVLRPLEPADEHLLRTATHVNLNRVGPERFTLADVDRRPDLRCYTVLDPDRGDLGFAARLEGRDVGVVWLQFLDASAPGHGFVADGVPELGLCVFSGYRGAGIGGLLLDEALAAADRLGLRVSLSVEAGNPARRLYAGRGFVAAPDRPDTTMLRGRPLDLRRVASRPGRRPARRAGRSPR